MQQPGQLNVDPAGLMKLVAAIFFISLALFVLLGVISVFSPSGGLSKAVGALGIVSVGALFGMLGALIYERHAWYRGQNARPTATNPGTPGYET